jgi:hypothetical protein
MTISPPKNHTSMGTKLIRNPNPQSPHRTVIDRNQLAKLAAQLSVALKQQMLKEIRESPDGEV